VLNLPKNFHKNINIAKKEKAMACPVIIRNTYGYYSYLVLDDHPRELLRHPGFQEEYSIRPWLGSTDPMDALEEWAEMLGEDIDYYRIADSDNRDFCCDLSSWDQCR
jgi:hypothetical protein